jgi:hypothetical protein
LLGEA